MSKKALRKDFYMEIKRSLGRFLSIFFIVAIGVAFFSGIRSAEPDMRFSGDTYFDQKNLMDIRVVSTLGLTDDDKQALENVDGIENVEASYSTDVLCTVNDSKKAIHIAALLPTMNQIVVEEGRLPKTTDECIIDVDFLAGSGYKIGDKITFLSGTDKKVEESLSTDTYTIVGTASSPCYISFMRGSTTIGDGTLSGFAYVQQESFQMDVYTEMYASVQGAKELTAFTDDYDDQISRTIDEVKTIKKTREDARHQEIVDDAEEKLNDAKDELETARKEANEKLADAKSKLDDGKTKLDDAKAQIADGYAQLEDSKTTLLQKQEEVTLGYEELTAQSESLDGKIAELNEVKTQYQALAASGMADEQTLTVMYAQISQGEAQIEEARAQLDAAKAQLDEGQIQINDGWAQVAQAEADLVSGESELTSKEAEWKDAQTKYDEAKTEADTKIADGEKKIKDAEGDISKIENAKWYIDDRSVLKEYTGYGENADRMKAIGTVFPVLFFLVAALISLTTMTRMVEEQRTMIGTLKALGYDRHSIAGKYIGYASLATVGGSLFGVLVGEKILPYIIITAYGILYRHMDVVEIPYNLPYGLAAAAAALACTLLATILSCMKELREQAAELMRPPAPKQGKRVLLERIPFIWRHLNFIWKATVRNLIRYKKRFFMTVFGIGGCMALLLVGFGLKDSIFDIAKLQYKEIQLFDATIILDDDASKAEKDEVKDYLSSEQSVRWTALNMQQVEVSKGKVKKDVYLNVPEYTEQFSDFTVFKNRVSGEQYKLSDEGAILTEKMAKTLDVKVGDTITLKDDEKGELELKIENICENYMGHYLYMSSQLYEQLYGETPSYNSIYLTVNDGNEGLLEKIGETVLETEGALNVSYTNDMQEQLDDMLGSLNIVLVVLVISAGMLAFVVLYNLNNINITERKRELATLKVLGFFDNEVSSYVYRENVILTITGALAGCLMGRILHQFIIVTVEVDSVMFGRNIDFSSYVFSFLITLAFSLFVNGVMYFKLRKIDMVESLKSVE